MGLISRVSSRTYRKPETKSFSKKKWLFPRSPNPECQRASPKSDPDSPNKPPPSRKLRLLPKKMTLVKQREVITKARAYAAEYAAEAKAFVNNTKAAKAAGNYFVEGEEKLALVIRIRGVNQISPKPKKTLQLLRLRQIGNACFIRLNKASIQMLRICDPFIAWGYPTQATIKNMIYKRGAVKINGQRIKISNNAVVEKSMGADGIKCIEDLVHEIYTVGENFKTVNNNLFPIKLSCPRGGWRKITNHFIEGGDFGNREQYINDLVKKMN